MGISAKEYRKRAEVVEKFEKQGVSLVRINNYWEKYKLRGGSNSLQDFELFIKQQRLLDEAQRKNEEELISKLEEEQKKKEISDLNLFPEETEPLPQPEPDNVTISEESKPNYLLYGGIGLAVLLGGIIIYKRK